MKKFVVFGVLLLVLMSVSLVAAEPNTLPGSGWNSGQQIQNVGAADAQVILTVYDAAGAGTSCGEQTLASGQSYTYLTDVDCAVAAGFQGSGVVSSNQPIVAAVNVNNKSGGGAAAGQYNGTDGGEVATSIAFPLVKSNHSGRTTTFYVQNASDQTNDITATFVVNGTTYTKDYADVPGYAMVVINPVDAGVPTGNGNVGSLTVVGTQPLAGTSLEHENAPAVASNLQASRAFVPSDYADTLYCPLVRYDYSGKKTTTGMQVQNVGTEDVDITVTYSVVSGSAVNPTVTISDVAPGASANFLQANDLASNTLASATVSAVASDGSGTASIAAVVNDKATASNPQRVSTYACFSGSNATDTISLPLVKEDFGGATVNTTGVQVQNVGTADATVTLTFVTSNGDTIVVTHTDPIGPGESKTFYRVANGGTTNITVVTGSLTDLDATNNGVVITSDGEPIVAIANESSIGGTLLQDTKNYEGFNQ